MKSESLLIMNKMKTETTLLVLFFNFFVISLGNCLKTTDTNDFTNGDLILSLLNHNKYLGTTIITFYSCLKTNQGFVSTLKTLSSAGYLTTMLKHFNNDFLNYEAVERMLYIVDVSCNFSVNLTLKANNFTMFNDPYKWLFIDNYNSDTVEVLNLFETLHILVDSDVTIATRTNKTKEYNLSKIYKRKQKLELIVEFFGIFTNGKLKVDTNFDDITAERRKNLGKILLNNCNVITHPESYFHLTDKRAKHVDTITKVNYIFMQHLEDLLNATMNFSFVGTWGYLGNDSQWTGMMGELTRKHADIGGTPLFFTSDRIGIIDYIAMTTPTKSKFVFRQPKLSYITNVYTLPFNNAVWLASFGIVVITAAGLYVGIRWEWHKKKHYHDAKNISNTEELRDDPVEVAFLAFAAVCQQGSSAIPYSIAGRIITMLLYICLMFLYTSYSANIVALLQGSSTSIQTLEDLLKSRLQIGVDDTVFNHFYFPNASEPVRRAIYLQKVAPPGQQQRYFPIEEGVRRLREGLFAFHVETGAGYKIVGETFMEDEKCGLQEIQFLQVPDPWLAVQKNSSFKEMIKIGLRKLHESGIQNREVSLLYTKKPICTTRGSSFVGVAIVDCYPAALVFVVGIAIAFGIFVLEIFADQFVKRRDRTIKWKISLINRCN